jgi:glycosyltransferase involved in cell wall biosynthesis
MTPSLAIVVCSRDRPQLLAATLAAIAGQHADDVLVVDSASRTDGTAAAAADAGVRSVRVDEPGLARARNAGLRATDADIVAFTDDDCEPEAGWAAAVRSAFDQSTGFDESTGFDQRIAFVLGRVVALGGDEQPVVQLETTARVFSAGDDVMRIGHGANFSVARTAWLDLGGFDELLGAGARFRAGEDTDFLWRALRGGWVGRFEPGAAVGHRVWRGRRDAFRTMYGYGVGQGAVATKVRRLGGRDAVRTLSGGTASRALRQAWRDLRAGYQFGALAGLGWAAGALRGQVGAALLPLEDGHLRVRSRVTTAES